MARIVNAYLDLAEMRAEEQVPMTWKIGQNNLKVY